MKMRGICVTDDIVLGDDVLLLDFDLDVGVYSQTPLVDLGRGQDQLARGLVEEGGAQRVVQDRLLLVSEDLDELQLLGIPNTYLAGH